MPRRRTALPRLRRQCPPLRLSSDDRSSSAHLPARVCRIRANEQPASNQPREPGTTDGYETGESAGHDGCAARDLNPEPADYESAALPIELAALEPQRCH